MDRIVVGVDGSASARDALHWAHQEALLRGGELHVVTAYEAPMPWVTIGDQAGTLGAVPIEVEGYGDLARETLATECAEVLGGKPGCSVHQLAAPGKAAHVLVELSREATMIVVGSRGHGDLGGLLLGSVGMHVVHHSHCPVVVVREPAVAREPAVEHGPE